MASGILSLSLAPAPALADRVFQVLLAGVMSKPRAPLGTTLRVSLPADELVPVVPSYRSL